MNESSRKGTLIGGIVSSVITIALIVFRMVCVSEFGRLQSGSTKLIHIGFKKLSGADYYAYVENLVNKSFLAITSFVLLTVVLFVFYFIQSKKVKEQESVDQTDTFMNDEAV